MPDPVPVMVLGRLAVDRNYQGLGIGAGLLRDAVLRVEQAAEIAGIRAILVHAISEQAKEFYLKHGFIASPLDSLTLMMPITGRHLRAVYRDVDGGGDAVLGYGQGDAGSGGDAVEGGPDAFASDGDGGR